MKKYFALSAATLLAVAFLLSMPVIFENTVVQVQVMHPAVRSANTDITVSGTVEAKGRQDVTVEIPVVAGQVNVSVGDSVEVNQVLAMVDTEATRGAILNLIGSSDLIPKEYISAMGSISGLSQLGLEEAQNYLSQDLIPTQIFAPTSGVVTSINMVPGTLSLPKTALCTISKTDSLRLKMSVGEDWADQVNAGDSVVFKANATGDENYAGKVERIFPSAVETVVGTSRQTVVGMYVDILGNTSRLKPGYSVNGVIRKPSEKKVMIIPYEAISQDEDNQEYVYIFQKSRAVRRNISTGQEFSYGAEVTAGLTSQDLLITDASLIPDDGTLAVIKNK